MARIKKIVIRLTLSLLALVVLATILVQTPSIQAKLVNYSAKTLTEQLGLDVKVAGVKIKPLKGSISLNGINCSDNEGKINLSCNELDVTDIEAVIRNQKVGDIILSDLHLKAASYLDIIKFFEKLPSNDGNSSTKMNVNTLRINNFSLTLADTLINSFDVLQAHNIALTPQSQKINSIKLINLKSNILDSLHISTLKGSISHDLGDVFTLNVDTIEHKHFNASGVVENREGIYIELDVRADPNKFIDTLEIELGEINGRFVYSDSTIIASDFHSSEGYFFNNANYELKNNNWEVDGRVEKFGFEIDIIAEGNLNSAIAEVKEKSKGIAEIQANWNFEEKTWILSAFSKAINHESIEFTNATTYASGDFDLDLIELIIESNEITARAKAITTPEKWRSLIKSGKTKDFISEGQLTINSDNFAYKALNFPIEISRGSEIHWDINGKENILQGNLKNAVYEGKTIEGLFFDFFSSTEDTWGNITGNKLLIEREARTEVLATDLSVDLHIDSVWAIDSYWKNTSDKTGIVRLEGHVINNNDYNFNVFEATIPIAEDSLILREAPAQFVVKESELISEKMVWSGGGFEAQLGGSVGDSTLLSFTLTTQSIDTIRSKKWFNIPFKTDSISIVGSVAGSLQSPQLFTTFRSDSINYKGQIFPRSLMLVSHIDGETEVTGAIEGLGDREGSIGFNGKMLDKGLELRTSALHLPLEFIIPFLPKNTVDLNGYLGGSFVLEGSIDSPQLNGNGTFEEVEVGVDYLGTSYGVDGDFTLLPDGIELNAIDVHDENDADAILVGTILHNNFKDWNLDITLMLDEEPMKIMDIPYSPENYFYGTGYGTGHINVFSFEEQIVIEANLTTHDGTEFILPMEVASESDWSSFVSIKSNENNLKPKELFTNSKVRLDLNLDVLESSKARIVFDEAVGDEIAGSCKGQIHVGIDDFERLEMFGDLEVVEGSYLFTLGRVFNKRFVARPGGKIHWFGNPYEADIDIETVYTTSASIQPVLPELASNNKQKVEVELFLKGELMRPGIVFDIVLPESSGEAQAALASMISNEEERNRQAMSLLVLHQFIPGSWQSAAIGSTGLQENSSELITSQLGNWLSGMSEDVSIGINYDSATDTGDEAAIAVALSTQILNDRLHIEGELGTNNLYSGTMDDVQLQDVRIKYDLSSDGNLQLTGYTSQRTNIPGFEGESVQGVGFLYHKDFDRLIEFFQRKR
jgi:hypothetical protein